MKKIMILGAGIYQLPLIKKAKELGYYIIVCSIPGNYPGFTIADKVYYENTTECEKILSIAIKEKIDGICTTGTDVAVRTIGYVCDHMGLSGISFLSSCQVTDKAIMKKAFLENKVNTARYFMVQSVDEALQAYDNLENQVFMKVTDKSGSRGIKKLNCRSAVEACFVELMAETNNDYLVMEEYINGHEIGIDAFVQNHKVLFIVPHDKITYDYNGTGIPIGHIFPYVCNANLREHINQQVNMVIKALDLNNCAVNLDAFVKDNDRISIIEVGGRAGATGIPELISMHYGIDFYKMIIDNAMGEMCEFNSAAANFCASRILFSKTDGILKEIHVSDKDNVEMSFDIKCGEPVKKFTNGSNRIGQLLFQAPNVQELYEKINRVNEYVKLVIE